MGDISDVLYKYIYIDEKGYVYIYIYKGPIFISCHEEQKKRLLGKIFERNSSEHALVFKDEKKSYHDQMVYSQNHRWIALFPQDVPIGIKKAKHPGDTIVFWWSQVMVTRFPWMKDCNKGIGEVLLTWIERVAARRPYVWQQVCSMSH